MESFVEDNWETVIDKFLEHKDSYPSDWEPTDHMDEIYEFVEDYMSDELADYLDKNK